MTKKNISTIKKVILILILLIPFLIFTLKCIDSIYKKTKSNDITYNILISDSRNNTFTIDSINNNSEATVIINLIQNGTPVEFSDFNDAINITVNISYENTNEIFKLFFYKDEKVSDQFVCYYSNGKNVFLANKTSTKSFCSLPFAVSLYPYSIPPSLTTFSLDTVIPSQMEWKYKGSDNLLKTVNNIPITKEQKRYFQNGQLNFTFSLEPSYANVTVSDERGIIYNGDLKSLSEQNIDKSGTLSITVIANWLNDSNNGYSGFATYNFIMDYIAPAQFSTNSDSVSAGGYIVMKGINITDSSKIIFYYEGLFDNPPAFFTEGTDVYSIIPIPATTLSRNLLLRISYGEIKFSFNITINLLPKLTEKELNVPLQVVDRFHTPKSIDEFSNILQRVTEKSDDLNFAEPTFTDPLSVSTAELLLSFGDCFNVNNLYSAVSFENYYSLPLGSSVYSLNSGKIDEIGFCDILGNYIVIDHGRGIKTWYAHLSEINVSKGDLVSKNSIIGRCGATGYAFTNGVSVFATIHSDIVSLNEIIKNGFDFN